MTQDMRSENRPAAERSLKSGNLIPRQVAESTSIVDCPLSCLRSSLYPTCMPQSNMTVRPPKVTTTQLLPTSWPAPAFMCQRVSEWARHRAGGALTEHENSDPFVHFGCDPTASTRKSEAARFRGPQLPRGNSSYNRITTTRNSYASNRPTQSFSDPGEF